MLYIISFFEWIVQEIRRFFVLLFTGVNVDGEEEEEEEEEENQWTDADRLLLFQDTCTTALEKALNSSDDVNLNVPAAFYKRADYNAIQDEDMVVLCREWKSRVLMTASPLVQQGNVLMYYDPSRLAFVYHCDFAVSNAVLEGFAMKYVTKFRCLDFFVDETVWKSPLLPLHALEDVDTGDDDTTKKEKEKEKKDKDDVRDFLKEHSSAFIAAKPDAKKVKVVPLVIKNRFVHKGKLMDYSFLSTEKRGGSGKKKVVLNKEAIYGIKPSMDCLFQDVYGGKNIEGMFEESTTPTFSYKDYKNRISVQGCIQ